MNELTMKIVQANSILSIGMHYFLQIKTLRILVM